MKKKREIPLFTVEEHHEAFIVWNYATLEGWIKDNGNCLFHVDSHSDMGTPRFNRSINDLKTDIDEIKRFTYKELGIATFIIPACYLGIFNQVYWIKPKITNQTDILHERYVRSYNQSGKRLISGNTKSLPKDEDIKDPDRKKYDYFLKTVEQIPSRKEVVLDIDLDYFSCNENPNELHEIIIEITYEEYHKFTMDPYHRLNYLGLYNIEAVKIDGKYYYIINKFNEKYPNKMKVDNKVIEDRIDNFIYNLLLKYISPIMIDICRSRFSGYTPNDQWDFIENILLEKLNKHFNIKQISLN